MNYILAFLIFLGIAVVFATLRYVLDLINEELDKAVDIDYDRPAPPEDSNFQ